MFASFFAEVPKQDQVQGYLLQGASGLMSPSEICSEIFFSLLLSDLTVLETPPPFPALPRNFAKKSIAV